MTNTDNQLSAIAAQLDAANEQIVAYCRDRLAEVNAQIDAYLREQTYNYDDLTHFVNDHRDYEHGIDDDRLFAAINAERDMPVIVTNLQAFLDKWMAEGKQPDTIYYLEDYDRFDSLYNVQLDAIGHIEWDVRWFLEGLELTAEQIAQLDPQDCIIDQLVELFADKELAFRWEHFYGNNDYWTKERYSSDFARIKNVKEIISRIAD